MQPFFCTVIPWLNFSYWESLRVVLSMFQSGGTQASHRDSSMWSTRTASGLTCAEETMHGKKWPGTHSFRPPAGRLAQREQQCRTPLLPLAGPCCTTAAAALAGYTMGGPGFVSVFLYVVSECVPTQQLQITCHSKRGTRP